MNQEEVVLCGSSAYTKKYYLNPDFQTAFIIAQGIVQFLNFFEGVCFRLSIKKD